jgi:hypothetical protein
MGGIDNEILQQLRILAFGFGLAMGTELDRLRDFAGGDKRSLELYQSFRDPQSLGPVGQRRQSVPPNPRQLQPVSRHYNQTPLLAVGKSRFALKA